MGTFSILFIFIIILFFILTLFKTRFGRKVESETFLKGFEITQEFKLLQDWSTDDFPVAIGRSFGRLLGVRQELYGVMGNKNGKRYLILKQKNISFM